jgi:hypothetical protein
MPGHWNCRITVPDLEPHCAWLYALHLTALYAGVTLQQTMRSAPYRCIDTPDLRDDLRDS